jgi:hypothetical protein
VTWHLSGSHLTAAFYAPPDPVDRDALRAEYRRLRLRSHLTVDLHERAALQASATTIARALHGAAVGDFDGTVIALLVEGDETHEYGDGDEAALHCTICFLGPASNLTAFEKNRITIIAKRIGEDFGPFTARSQSPAEFGDTPVRLVEHPEIAEIHDTALADRTVGFLADTNETHPHFLPHVSGLDDREDVRFDRVAAMIGGDNRVFPLTGGTQTETPDADKDEEPDFLKLGA